MDLNDIVVFTKVVETKSFTGAAEQLGLPKSTVSRKLAQLEERLGVRLVQRTTRKLALTDIGQAYYERASRIVADVMAAEQLVTDMQATPRGRVRVTASVDISTRVLGPVCADFLSKHPDVNVELDATDRIVDLIEDGFDVALRIGPLSESTLIAKRLCALDFVLCASPAYLAARGTPANVDDLDAHDRVLFTPSARIQSWPLTRTEGTYEFGRPARFASNNVGAIRGAALAGAGIALVPKFMVADDLTAGTLIGLLPEWTAGGNELFAVYPARQNLPPRLALFIDFLAAKMASCTQFGVETKA